MNKVEDIGIVHGILLDMAKEFHNICVEENIPYYMLGGTMLGAIRHKGFIPWDDDMDFGIPIEYYEKTKVILARRFNKRYKFTTHQTDLGNRNAFIKIADMTTHIDDPTRRLPLERQLGINIDIFPLLRCDADALSVKKLHFLCRLYTIIYTESTKGGRIKALVKKMLRYISPFTDDELLDSIIAALYNAHKPHGKFMANYLGAWGPKETVHEKVMGAPTLYPFEDTFFYGVECPHEYLSSLYGNNYMVMPPENKRRGHAINIYKAE